MPYDIVVKDQIRTYTVTTSNWVCEWIVSDNSDNPVKRQCYLKDQTLDLLDTNNAVFIHSVLPEIVNEVNVAVAEWIKQGDPNASRLLSPNTIPAYLAYALTVNTGSQ